MSTADRAIAWTMLAEGGFVQRSAAADPGGATNHGITQATLDDWNVKHPDDGFPRLVRDLSDAQATNIYREEFWSACRCDDLPPPVALAVFDCAVTSGPRAAVKWLQRAVNATPDGRIGPETLSKMHDVDSLAAALRIIATRLVYMNGLTNWRFNAGGWINRSVLLASEVTLWTLGRG